jgi:putative flippase GtrA
VSARARSPQFALFLLAGGVAATANYVSRFGFSLWFAFPLAIALAYGVGMITAFVLMRRYVFQAHGKQIVPQAVKFVLVNAFALLQTMLVSLLLARWVLPSLGISSGVEALAHAAGVAFPVFTSYLLHKHATFVD